MLETSDDIESVEKLFDEQFTLAKTGDVVSPESQRLLAADASFPLEIQMTFEEDVDFDRNRVIKGLNGVARRWRQKRYRRKVAFFERNNWDLVKIVSEGDSWFQYPIIREDIIDQIFKPFMIRERANPFAVFSLGGAADKLDTIVKEEKETYIKALRDHEPAWFLLGGGGNDLLEVFEQVIVEFSEERSDRKVDDYINIQALNQKLKEVMGFYREIFSDVIDNKEFNDVKILCHGYDYVRPTVDGEILGSRLIKKNIKNETTMFNILKFVIDLFNDKLEEVVAKQSASPEKRVFYVDCRNSADANDFNTLPADDFHPSSKGFEKIANRFLKFLV